MPRACYKSHEEEEEKQEVTQNLGTSTDFRPTVGEQKAAGSKGLPSKQTDGVRLVAITGAGGFLGQLARAECEALGYEVRGIDLAQPKCQGGPRVAAARVADSSKVDVAIEDMSREGSMTGVLEGCQSVIHLAADGRPSADFMADVLPSNIQATFHLLKEAERAKVKRVIFASTNHTQHGATMGDHPGKMSWTKLQQLGGAASIQLSDPLGRTGPDSFYAVSKVFGEALGYLFSRVHHSFEFVALRIGWCLYEKPTDLKGDECEDYLRCMFLSQRDFKGFLRAALQRDLARHQGFLVAYAVSRNGLRSFDLQETIDSLGYQPVDDAEDYYTESTPDTPSPTAEPPSDRLPRSAAMAGPMPWRGRYVETPCGRWGICCKETADELEVLLDTSNLSAADVSAAGSADAESSVTLRADEVRRSSWCALGTCVLSSFGPGVVLRYRLEDDMHEVQLWGPLSQGQNRAFLRREALQEVLPALPGLAVETSSGSGICQAASYS
eukprot:s130_g42.t3